MVTLIAQQLMLPLTHTYLPNLEKNIWAPLQDPFYDRGARYSVPVRRLARRHRLAQRQDRQGHRRHEGAVGHLLGVEALDGKVGILDDERDALACRCSATRCARAHPRPQHRGPGDHREGGQRPRAAHDHQQHQGRHHRLPDAARSQVLAASLVVGRPARRGALLPAQGHASPTCSRSGARTRTAWSRTTRSSSRASPRSPCSRTRFLNFMLDEKNAYDNFVQFNGYVAAAERRSTATRWSSRS